MDCWTLRFAEDNHSLFKRIFLLPVGILQEASCMFALHNKSRCSLVEDTGQLIARKLPWKTSLHFWHQGDLQSLNLMVSGLKGLVGLFLVCWMVGWFDCVMVGWLVCRKTLAFYNLHLHSLSRFQSYLIYFPICIILYVKDEYYIINIYTHIYIYIHTWPSLKQSQFPPKK